MYDQYIIQGGRFMRTSINCAVVVIENRIRHINHSNIWYAMYPKIEGDQGKQSSE